MGIEAKAEIVQHLPECYSDLCTEEVVEAETLIQEPVPEGVASPSVAVKKLMEIDPEQLQ